MEKVVFFYRLDRWESKRNDCKSSPKFSSYEEDIAKRDLLKWKFPKALRKREKLQESFKNRKPWVFASKSALLVKAWARSGTDLTQQRNATHSHRLGFRSGWAALFSLEGSQPGQHTRLSDGKLDYLKIEIKQSCITFKRSLQLWYLAFHTGLKSVFCWINNINHILAT